MKMEVEVEVETYLRFININNNIYQLRLATTGQDHETLDSTITATNHDSMAHYPLQLHYTLRILCNPAMLCDHEATKPAKVVSLQKRVDLVEHQTL